MIRPRRGEIWYVDLDPTRGAEMQKTRPCVVLSADAVGILSMKLVVPLTGWKPHFYNKFWLVKIAAPTDGLTKDSAADTLQTRGADISRFGQQVGTLPPELTEKIVDALMLSAGRPVVDGERNEDTE